MSAGFELIDDVELTSAAASIVVPVDTDYRRFRLTFFGIKDGTAGAIQLRLNNDSGSNYTRQYVQADNNVVSGARAGQDNVGLANATMANGTAVITYEIEKPAAGVPGRITQSSSYMRSSADAITLEESTYNWNNTSDLISEIRIITSSANYAVGSRLVLEGAKQ